MCLSVLDGQWNWVIASIALAVVLMTAWLTGYSDYLTNIQEPLSAPNGCHTGFTGVTLSHWVSHWFQKCLALLLLFRQAVY